MTTPTLFVDAGAGAVVGDGSGAVVESAAGTVSPTRFRSGEVEAEVTSVVNAAVLSKAARDATLCALAAFAALAADLPAPIASAIRLTRPSLSTDVVDEDGNVAVVPKPPAPPSETVPDPLTVGVTAPVLFTDPVTPPSIPGTRSPRDEILASTIAA